MRRHLLGVFQGFFCTILLSSEALPAVTMVFDDFPASPFGCEFEAKELGERLKALGVRVNSAQCYRDNLSTKTYELRVQYAATSPVVDESTYKSGTNFYSKGWYKTLDECEADLDKQTRKFQNLTGLEPYISYCSKKGSSYSTRPYWPRIHAIGKGDLTLNVDTVDFSYTVKADLKEVQSDMEKHFSRADKQLVYSSIDSNVLTVGFYAPKVTDLNILQILRFRSLTECEDSLETVKDIYKQDSNPPFSIFCGEGSYSYSQPMIAGVIAGSSGLSMRGYYNYYATMQDCQDDLPTVTADLTATGDTPIGVVCSFYYSYYIPYAFYTR
jgi:hypothetical protein